MVIYKIIKIGNYGKITPTPEGSLAKGLDKYLSYIMQGAEFMPNPQWAVQHLYSVKKGVFAWGLLSKVKKILTEWKKFKGEDFIVEHTYIKPKNYILSEYLRYYQKEAITKLVDNGGGLISFPTRSGKTLTMIHYANIFKLKTIVIVPTLKIKKLWEE